MLLTLDVRNHGLAVDIDLCSVGGFAQRLLLTESAEQVPDGQRRKNRKQNQKQPFEKTAGFSFFLFRQVAVSFLNVQNRLERRLLQCVYIQFQFIMFLHDCKEDFTGFHKVFTKLYILLKIN